MRSDTLHVLHKVLDAFDVQGINSYANFTPFGHRSPGRIGRARLDDGGDTSVYLGGRQHRAPRLVRQTVDGVHGLPLALVRQPDHPRRIFFQLPVAQCPGVPIAAHHSQLLLRVVHVLGGHVAPAQLLAVGHDVTGDVHELQHL